MLATNEFNDQQSRRIGAIHHLCGVLLTRGARLLNPASETGRAKKDKDRKRGGRMRQGWGGNGLRCAREGRWNGQVVNRMVKDPAQARNISQELKNYKFKLDAPRV